MKKILILAIVLSFVSSFNLLAQKRKTNIGFLGALNIANVSGDIDDSESRLGFVIGGFLQFNLNPRIAMRTELHFTSKGFSVSDKESESSEYYEYSVSNETTTSLNYIEVPILGVLSLHKNISVFAGPYLDYFLSGEYESETDGYIKYNNVTENMDESDSEDIKSEDINTPGFGLIVGAEYVLNKISVGARYSLGLSNIPDSDEADFKHSVIQLYVGFALR